MPKKIRIYELARELGVENAQVIELSDELKIGVKSHSSSIEEAQADRVRRLARERGIAKSREEMEAERKAEEERLRQEREAAGERKVVRAGTRPAASDDAPAPAPAAPAPAPSAPAAPEPVAASAAPAAPAAPEAPHRVVRSTVQHTESEEAPARPAPRPAAAAPAAPPPPAAPAPPAAAPPPPAEVAPPAAAAPPAEAEAEAAPPVPEAPEAGEVAEAGEAAEGEDADDSQRRPPVSASGKPIPPPPGLGGRKIPPPPRGRPGGGPGGGGPGGGGGHRSSPGPRVGMGGGGPGAGAPPGRGGPPPPGRGRPGGPPQRRRKKRRRRQEELEPQQMNTFTPADAPVPEGEIVIERGITPQEYAPKLNRTAADLVRMMLDAGEMLTATQSLSDEMIELIADELGAEIVLVDPGQEEEVELQAMLADDDEEDEDDALLEPRPPVVTVMGHVDHGKTLLLDKIREANVVSQEAGGITQHIGAYQAEHRGRRVTFIDTPGHEAFTAMRARGAEATDIAILVVAADDGVMPQTVEAINHAKAAEVPIVVAINKVDKATPEEVQRVKQQLSEHGLVPEEWGGDTVMDEISALQNLGVDTLLESVLLVADVQELVANPKVPARGVVLEANLDAGRGPVATVIIERGTLRQGDPVVAGAAWGRVRALLDDRGERIEEAGPSTPVEILGFSEVPTAGDELRAAPDEKIAKIVAESRGRRRRKAELLGSAAAGGAGTTLDDVFAHIQRGEVATLNLILKADVQGSLEALTEALRKLERPDVKVAFVHRGVGGITESDVQLAAASSATIIGFNVRPDRIAREMADQHGVGVRLYEVIYKAIEEIQSAMLGMLEPEFEEVVTGDAEVREIFSVPRIGRVAGCYVTNGVIKRGDKVRFLRDGVIIWKGTISSLKRFKDDVREVASGYECGIGLENYQDLKQGDVIETFEEREIPRV